MKKITVLLLCTYSAITIYAQYNNTYEKADEWKGRYSGLNLMTKNVEWQSCYDIRFANINVEVYDTSNHISGNVLYNSIGTGDLSANLSFQLVPELVIDSVLVDNISCTFNRSAELVTVTLPYSINLSQLFTWQVFYHGQPINPVNYRGLFHIYDWGYLKNVTYTLSEPFHLKEWLPCKEDLTDKIDSVWTFITTDTSCMAGSSGLLTNVEQLGSGKHRFEWKTRYPMVFYLLSLNVADYMEYNLYAHPEGYSDSILVQNFLFDTTIALQNLKNDIDQTPGIIEGFSKQYGLYPFHLEKYGHCQVKLPGAMEHQTMTTLGAYWALVIAHELSHQWFGNYVTCATWQDIWINEGWATFSEYLFYENKNDSTNMVNWKNQAFFHSKQQVLGSIYIPFEEANDESRIFSYDLSYKKGGSMIIMLRYLINNDSLFFAAAREFLSVYANSNATGDQLMEVFEDVTSVNLQPFFNEWYYGQGYPIFDISWHNIQTSSNSVNINMAVTGSSPLTNFFSLPVPFKLNLNNGADSIVYITPTGSTDNYIIETGTALCQSLEFDPYNNIVDSLRSLSQSSPEMKSDETVRMYYSDKEQVLEIVIMHSWLLPLNVTVYSADGKKLLTRIINQSHSSIHLNELPCAVYSACLENNAIHYKQKFVKSH